jgi:hypothetical protein
MDCGFDIQWVEESKIPRVGIRYKMDRGFDIPWVGGLCTKVLMVF